MFLVYFSEIFAQKIHLLTFYKLKLCKKYTKNTPKIHQNTPKNTPTKISNSNGTYPKSYGILIKKGKGGGNNTLNRKNRNSTGKLE